MDFGVATRTEAEDTEDTEDTIERPVIKTRLDLLDWTEK
jgi:hypothetical protein